MSNTVTLRNTCSIDCGCTSPPGVPNGISTLPFLNASAGFGVSRGRLPGPTEHGCVGSDHDCVPRPEHTKPTPGTVGELFDPSEGVAENALPCRSIQHVYVVSPGPGASSGCAGVIQRCGRSVSVAGSPAGGMPGHARSALIIARRWSEYLSESRPFMGTFTKF